MRTAVSIAVVLVLLLALWEWRRPTAEEPSTALEAAALESARFDGEEPVVAEPPLADQVSREAVDGEDRAPRALAADEIAGRVITFAGEPISGARVRVVLPRARQWPRLFFDDVAESELPVAEGRTDARGEFSLRVDGERLLDLYASAEGFAEQKRAGLYAGARIELVLARAASLAGRVTRASDGAPVEGARLVMRQGVIDLPGRVELRTTTDARGEYRFEGLVPGWYQGRVSSEREVATSVDGGDGYLARGGLGTGALQAPTDAEGRFVFADLPAGHWILKGDAKGYVHAAQVEFDLAPGEKRTGVELALDVGLSISGVVTDEEGRPLPGSVVDVYHEGSGVSLIYDLAREDGSFSVHGLDPGRYRVRADEGFGASGRAWSESTCAAGQRDVHLRLGRAVSVHVRVVDRTGAPLPGAYVGIGTDVDGFSMQASDAEGRTSVRVPEHGSFDLMASANPTFDPGADFFRSSFRDENGKPLEDMQIVARGLVATSDEIVLTIPGLP